MNELHRKYRPQTWKQVLGQKQAVQILTSLEQPAHSVLFYGPSGVGKTTLARLYAKQVGCNGVDFNEMNTADYRGIDSIRAIRRTLGLAPIQGKSRVYLLDECHKLTSDAQNSILKMLEEPPDHVYFMLCTTEPERLLRTVLSRCLPIHLEPLSPSDLLQLLGHVIRQEELPVKKSVAERIIEYADGSAREALQILDSIRNLKTSKEQITNIERSTVKAQIHNIAAKLLNTRSKWPEIKQLLVPLKEEDTERIRRMILGYASAVLIRSNNDRAYRMIELFRENFFDCGFAGVVAGCYELTMGTEK